MKRFFEVLNNASTDSLKLMFYGAGLSFGVLLIGFLAYLFNKVFMWNYQNGMLSIELIRSGFSLFVQFVLGGIILDCVLKNK